MQYLLRRTVFLLGTLWVAITLNFFIPRLMPGNPAETMMAKFAGRGQQLSPVALHSIEVMLGISHASLWSQYGQYLIQVIHFNFGLSYSEFPYTVRYVIAQSLPWTLGLVGLATIISFIIGTGFGIYAAWKRDRASASIVTTISAFTGSFPYFWFALAIAYFLAFKFHWLPLTGGYAIGISPHWTGSFILDVISHGILPALTIVVSSVGGWLLAMRNNMINTLGEDFVLLANAKGLPDGRIALQYVARNAILPSVTGFGMALGFVVGGSLLTEIVFAYPGMGYLLYNAVVNEDYPLMQGIFLIIVLAVVIANFLADLMYFLVDPRVRSGGDSV